MSSVSELAREFATRERAQRSAGNNERQFFEDVIDVRGCRKITFTIWEASTDQSVDGGSSSTPGSAGVAEDSESSFVPC
jgi:hypothetical protein